MTESAKDDLRALVECHSCAVDPTLDGKPRKRCLSCHGTGYSDEGRRVLDSLYLAEAYGQKALRQLIEAARALREEIHE